MSGEHDRKATILNVVAGTQLNCDKATLLGYLQISRNIFFTVSSR